MESTWVGHPCRGMTTAGHHGNPASSDPFFGSSGIGPKHPLKAHNIGQTLGMYPHAVQGRHPRDMG